VVKVKDRLRPGAGPGEDPTLVPAAADETKVLLDRIAQMLTKAIKSRRPTE